MCRLEKDGVLQCNFYLPARSSAWAVKEDIDVVRTQWVHADRSSFALQVVGAHVQNSLSSVDSFVEEGRTIETGLL